MNYGVKTLAQLTLDVAGTEEQLTTNTDLKVRSVIIQWDSTNDATDLVYVGGSDVDSTHMVVLTTSDRSITIESPQGERDAYIQLSTIWLDTNANGTKVNVMYLERV